MPETAAALDDSREHDRPGLRLAAVGIVGLSFVFAAWAEFPPLNGPDGAEWPWRHIPFVRTAVLLLPPVLLLATVLHWIDRKRIPERPVTLLATITACAFALQIGGILAHPRGLSMIGRIVASPLATSYFTDAARIGDVRGWLAAYPPPDLSLHSRTHPPGPILFYWLWQRLLAPEAAAVVGGCSVGFLGSLGIPVLYSFSGLWTEDRRVRLTACILFALSPSLALFFPEFDQMYPALAMALFLFWIRSLEGRMLNALAAGLVLFVATFFAYNLLTTGAFLALAALVRMRGAWRDREAWKTLAASAAILITVATAAHLLLHFLTGYRPIAALGTALATEHRMASGYDRPYFLYLALNLYDFFLGTGILILPLVLQYLHRVLDDAVPWRRDTALSLAAIGAVLAVDLSGTLSGETARVWLFLQPLVLIPAALEFCRFGLVPRLSVLVLQALLLVTTQCKLDFIIP